MKIIDKPRSLPSIHQILRDINLTPLIREYGILIVTQCVQTVLSKIRKKIILKNTITYDELVKQIKNEILGVMESSLKPVINLTGTVLHTNLGRAQLPETAIQAMVDVARGASSLEYDLENGKRGDRHRHSEELICRLTGAQAAVVVNNNAAAVLLTLNSLAKRKEVLVSRGELIEIGGAFRMPDIMSQAGCKLVEVGTTNRTHSEDFDTAISTKTALLMKVHTSNFEIKGFTKNVSELKLSNIAHNHNLRLVTDLGSGTLIDLETYGLPHETTVNEALKAGSDIVTFSTDKLLGGPQAGIIAGRSDLIEKIKKNPMMRAVRPDKMSLAALDAVLKLYLNPDRLAEVLPTIRLLSRDLLEIEDLAKSLVSDVQGHCTGFNVVAAPTHSQVGSGALPTDRLKSYAIKITKAKQKQSSKSLDKLAKAFRALPVPIIGRISDNALWFDVRCLENIEGFKENLKGLVIL